MQVKEMPSRCVPVCWMSYAKHSNLATRARHVRQGKSRIFARWRQVRLVSCRHVPQGRNRSRIHVGRRPVRHLSTPARADGRTCKWERNGPRRGEEGPKPADTRDTRAMGALNDERRCRRLSKKWRTALWYRSDIADCLHHGGLQERWAPGRDGRKELHRISDDDSSTRCGASMAIVMRANS